VNRPPAAQARPRIGISANLERASWGAWDQQAALLPVSYIRAIQGAGGHALIIPPDPELVKHPEEVLDLLDGLILSGGADVEPAAYGAQPEPETSHTVPERDALELALTRRALELDLPFLGICRGMQVLNVACGGTLHQHLPRLLGHEEHRPHLGSFVGSDHPVQLRPGSLAERAAGEQLHTSLSHHHQAIDELGEGLEITGYSTLDELPEAIERPTASFVLGVQWHPEADPASRIIAALVQEARRRLSRRLSTAA
jgi:putative glutamine amidotransferase